MPMGEFKYTKAAFFDAVALIAAGDYNSVIGKLRKDPRKLRRIAKDPDRKAAIAPGDRNHFIDHWLTPSASGNSEMFPYVSTERIEKTLRRGFQVAFELARDNPDAAGNELPVHSLWVCNSGIDTFDVVASLNDGVNVQVVLVTPPPAMDGGAGVADSVWVTRSYASDAEIQEIRQGLAVMGAPAADQRVLDTTVMGTETEIGAGEAGVFRVWS